MFPHDMFKPAQFLGGSVITFLKFLNRFRPIGFSVFCYSKSNGINLMSYTRTSFLVFRARLFERGLTPNLGLNRLNLRLNFIRRLVLLFEGKLTLTSG